MSDDRQRLTTTEAAAHFGVNARTISKWITSGRLEGVKEDGRWIVLIEPAEEGDPPTGNAPHEEHEEAVESNVIALGPSVAQSVDIGPAMNLIADLTAQIGDLSAAAAMWQERARTLKEELDSTADKLLAIESGPIPEPEEESKRGGLVTWWRRLWY